MKLFNKMTARGFLLALFVAFISAPVQSQNTAPSKPEHGEPASPVLLGNAQALMCDFDPDNDSDPDGCMGPPLRCRTQTPDSSTASEKSTASFPIFMNALLDLGWKVQRQEGPHYYLRLKTP